MMRQNLIYPGHWFVAVLILAIGLISYGCKDSVSISEDVPVPLSSLVVTPGFLQPAFSSNTTSYLVDVSTTVTSVTVTAAPRDSKTIMSINGVDTNPGQGRPVPLSSTEITTNITIVLTNQSGTESTYDLVVRKVDNNLSALSMTPGSLVPTFAAGTLNYQVDVDSGVTSVTVVATKADLHAVMSGSVIAGAGIATGKATTPLNGPGLPTVVSITVAVPNGEAKTYTVTVNRAASSNNNLSALTVTPGSLTPGFAAGSLLYTVDVATDVTSVLVSATKADPNAVISGDLPNEGQATILLDGPGTSRMISIIVTAQDTVTTKTYTITVNRAASNNNNLSELTVASGASLLPLSPTFNSGVLDYIVNVASSVFEVIVTARLADTNASMTIAGQGTSSGQPRNISLVGSPPSSTDIEIIAIAQDGSQKPYRITVNRAAPSSDANLSAVSVSVGALNQPFDSNILDYTVDVPTDVDSITITATKSESNSVMSALGSVIAPSGTPTGLVTVSLGLGTSTPVEITVIAQDGATLKLYTITVTRPLP